MNFSLSDEAVVKYLILARHKLDPTYNSIANVDIHIAGDTFELNQELIAIYVSLDRLIENAKLKPKEMQILKLIFQGCSFGKIQNELGFNRLATVYENFSRIAKRIVRQNNKEWRDFINKRKSCS